MCIAIVLLVLAGIYLAKNGKLNPPPWLKHHHSPEDNALRILSERLANGEISAEEYRERVEVIRQNASPTHNPTDLR